MKWKGSEQVSPAGFCKHSKYKLSKHYKLESDTVGKINGMKRYHIHLDVVVKPY